MGNSNSSENQQLCEKLPVVYDGPVVGQIKNGVVLSNVTDQDKKKAVDKRIYCHMLESLGPIDKLKVMKEICNDNHHENERNISVDMVFNYQNEFSRHLIGFILRLIKNRNHMRKFRILQK